MSKNAIAIDFKTAEAKQVLVGLLGRDYRVVQPDHPDAQAVLVEVSGPLDSARLSHHVQAGRDVIAASADTGRDVLLAALRTGAQEFIALPPAADELHQALINVLSRQTAPSRPAHGARIFDVVGVKGGVGATTVAVNLAHSLATPEPKGRNKKADPPSVCLVDMNMAFGEVPLFLDIEPLYNWGEIMRNIDRLDAAYLMGVLSRHPSGLYVLPAPNLMEDRVEVTAPALDRLFTVLRETFDFVIVDGGSYLDEVSFNIMALSSRVMLVSSLSLPCLANLRKVSTALSSLGAVEDADVRVIYNRYLSNAEISVEDAEEIIGRKAFWLVPNDYKDALSAINQGRPLLETAPKCKAAKALLGMANTIRENRRQTEEERTGGLFGMNLFSRAATV